MKTIKEAIKKGASVRRECRYYATDPQTGITFSLMPDAHVDYLYSFRKMPKKRKIK